MGPRFSGSGIEPSESPPVLAASSEGGLSRAGPASAEVTIRVAAMGESAFTVTPAGATSPSCQVSEATARLAQPYAPVFAGRQPEPEVTPRIRPDPASAMSGRAARKTFR